MSYPPQQQYGGASQQQQMYSPQHMPQMPQPAYYDPQQQQQGYGSQYDINGIPMHQMQAGYSQLGRTKTVRRAIPVRDGKLVVDLNVSRELLNPTKVKYAQGEEFEKLRYTACTSDPDNFLMDRYTLRQAMYARKTELFIVVTMYNEDAILFTRTMEAINKNIIPNPICDRQQHMCAKKTGPFAGETGWQKIVVCIVSDGRTKVNKDVLTVLASMGVYQEGVCVPKFAGKETTAHIFEYTSQFAVNDKIEVRNYRDGGVVPVQILFCLKEKNAKKINSHRWFFNAFAPVLQPNVCCLVDVGTKPKREAIYRLWRTFDMDPQVGGACGEIAVEWDNLLHLMTPIIAAQNFEYKMSNILDKPLESWAGYISVLPGAFSAYRYKALQGRPLSQYFLGEKLHGTGGDVFSANMYLAEDRILCFELVAKAKENWVLRYEKDSQAITDVPDSFPEFISQRRRWLNGSTFALLYALGNVGQIYRSGQSFLRMLVFTLEFVYMALNFVFSYLSLANFYLAFHFLVQGFVDSISDPNNHGDGFWGIPTNGSAAAEILVTTLLILRPVYILCIAVTFISALGNRPQAAKYIYLFSICLFSIITIFMFYIIVVTTAKDARQWNAAAIKQAFRGNFKATGVQTLVTTSVAVGCTYGIYFLSSFAFREPWHMFTSFIQYLLLLPTYVNVLQIYAYCNISDVSWGTKGDNGAVAGEGVKVKQNKEGEEVADLDLPSQDHSDVATAYQARLKSLSDLKVAIAKGEAQSKESLSNDDYFKQFRTIWLLIWIIFNGGLMTILVSPHTIGSAQGEASISKTYLTYLFVAVAVFSVIRFIGSMGYLFSRGVCSPFSSRGNAGR
ncbi:hypothetical protein RI367_006931 [Sorochytrium milnesiophthora]